MKRSMLLCLALLLALWSAACGETVSLPESLGVNASQGTVQDHWDDHGGMSDGTEYWEIVFSPEDAVRIMQTRAADLVNIKLMKCGGLYNALKIVSAAEVYGVECMIGCMLEAKISVNAAVHLACAKKIITKIDLDGPVLCSEDPILGGAVFDEQRITVSDEPGLGIKGVEKMTYLD